MAAWSWAVFVITLEIPVCLASGVLEFHMISFSSKCQETWGDACDHYLTFCFDKATNSPNIGSCAYKRMETGVYNNANDLAFGSNMNGVSNPIIVPIQNFSDPRVLLVLRSMDKDDTTADNLVVTVSMILTVYPSSSRSRASYTKVTSSLDGNTFVHEYLAYCESDFYGPQCAVFCQVQTDTSGNQYLCDPDTGAIRCQEGWTGESCTADIDECVFKPCADAGAACVNMRGSYKCVCPAGTIEIGDGLSISDCVETTVRDDEEVKQDSFQFWPIIVAIAALLVTVIIVAIGIVCILKRRKESKPVLSHPPSHVVAAEASVYNEIDEPGSRSPLDRQEQRKKKDKTGGVPSACDNVDVPRLEIIFHEVKDNSYDDFNSLQKHLRQVRKEPTAPVYEGQPTAASGQRGAEAARKVPTAPEGTPEQSRKRPTEQENHYENIVYQKARVNQHY